MHRTLKTKNDVDHGIDTVIKEINNSVSPKYQITENRVYKNPPLNIQQLIKEKHNTRTQWMKTKDPRTKTYLNQLNRKMQQESSYAKYTSELEPLDPTMWRATTNILKQQHIIPTIKIGTR